MVQVLPPYATQPLPALHETEQDARDSAMTSVLGGQRAIGDISHAALIGGHECLMIFCLHPMQNNDGRGVLS